VTVLKEDGMPSVLHLVLLVFALVCFVLATWRFSPPDWNRLVAAGLAFLVASMISW
jgi:hypothetical protein